MKKILSLGIALLLTVLLLSGCKGGDKENASSEPLPSTVPTVSPTPVPEKKAKALRVKADGGLNVRASGSTEAEILGLADNGSKLPLMVEKEKDGWYQIQYNGKTAFVSAEFVDVIEVTLDEYNQLVSGKSESTAGSASSPASSAPEDPGKDDPGAGKTNSKAEATPSPTPEVTPLGGSEDGE